MKALRVFKTGIRNNAGEDLEVTVWTDESIDVHGIGWGGLPHDDALALCAALHGAAIFLERRERQKQERASKRALAACRKGEK